MKSRDALVALNGFLLLVVAFFATVGWLGARIAARPGGGGPATWLLTALQLIDAIAFGLAALAHARSWRRRWLLQALPLLLLAAAPVLAHLLISVPRP